MVGLTHISQLTLLVNNKKNQGILDNNIDNVLRLHNRDQALFVMNLILNCRVDADTAIPVLDTLLNQEVVNFEKAKTYAIAMKAGARCLGGCRMSQVCQELRLQCEAENKSRCLELLQRVKEEYVAFHDCLNHISEIVRNILVSGVGFRQA